MAQERFMITVVTPLQRKENIDLLSAVLKDKCDWVVLIDDESLINLLPTWAKIIMHPKPKHGSNELLNSFFEHGWLNQGLEDETQYMVLCDDDSVEPDFFDKIPNEDVVCVSMQRNDVPARHGVWDDWATKSYHFEDGLDLLVASPENMKPAKVGGEQLIVKGKILKNFRYGYDDSTADVPGDFAFIRDVIAQHPVTYVPEARVLFNYFEDGRFKAFRRKPLVLFIGDYFCAGMPAMGKSEWEGNIAHSLDSSGVADVVTFHPDKYFYATGKRGDEALLKSIAQLKPDYVVLIIYKQPASDPTVISLETIRQLPNLITIWGDLEATEQVELSKLILSNSPQMRVFGTANKSVVESLGYKYMHVPKDSRIFNNPNKERDIDLVFSGSFGRGREDRQKPMQYLLDNGIKMVFGGSEGGDHFTTEEYADRYKRAKMALSFSQARGMNVVNARPFEAMNCGAMLLEQESPELAKLYTPFVDYVPWKDEVDLLEKVRYYLEHEDERKQIADSGYKKTQELYSDKTFWKEVLMK